MHTYILFNILTSNYYIYYNCMQFIYIYIYIYIYISVIYCLFILLNNKEINAILLIIIKIVLKIENYFSI